MFNVLRQHGRSKNRPQQICRVARKLADRHKRRSSAIPRPFMRRTRKSKPHRMIAYDLETTRIQVGTPRPLYLTAYGADFHFSGKLESLTHLRDILLSQFLIPENNGARFIAWNGNNFDVFFIGACLLCSPQFILRPFLTHTKALRGIKVQLRTKPGKPKVSWEFLDGASMLVGTSPITLKKFLKTFAPAYQKLDGPDFEKEIFNPENPSHVAYAERDSEGLYHGLTTAESLLQQHFGQGLQPTIGNLGIRLFQSALPVGVQVWAPGYDLDRIIRSHVMRGGFCFAAKHYEGPVWKYDINQAYASAMRDCALPSGRVQQSKTVNPYARAAIYRVTARNRNNRVPFYCRDDAGKAHFALAEIDSWITSSELTQLKAEKWSIVIHDGYFWEDAFSMRELVDRLESLRMADPDGPNGAQGTLMKSLGNNSYGKTLEELDGLEILMSAHRPADDFFNYQNADDTIQHLWAKIGEPHPREYHQPQLGAFITAHVRMVVRRAILQAPDAWLYSDTDCCFFNRAVALDIDPKKYGKWKIECEGEPYRIITKKVYASMSPEQFENGRHAKGMNVKRLSMRDFENWYNGSPPTQTQVHRQNFLAVMTGADMFVQRVKIGQRK
jgi:DNA polymerase type B, organellar and viral